MLHEMTRKAFMAFGASAATMATIPPVCVAETKKPRWWKGNLHTHTFLSDGEAFPQEAALLYRKLGYNFLCLTDHNRTHVHRNKLCNEKTTKRFFRKNMARFEKYFPGWLPKPVIGADGIESYRLDTFDEMAKRLNKPGEFLLMNGCEWHNDTDFQLHCNVTNTFAEQHPYRFGSVEASLEDLFLQYEKKIGLDDDTSMFTVNHPVCWFFDLDPMMLVRHPQIQFFEVANCDSEPSVKPPDGMWTHDKFWDVVLAHRYEQGLPPIYAVAVDDTHMYTPFYNEFEGGKHVIRGYVRIRSDALEPNALVRALRRGDFHASTGVDLKDVHFDRKSRTLSVSVDAKPGLTYVIRFLGTQKGFDKTTTEVGPFTVVDLAEKQGLPRPTEGVARLQRRFKVYSRDIGKVLKETEGVSAKYTMTSNDLYVRAKIFVKATPGLEDEVIPKTPVAWTQPFA